MTRVRRALAACMFLGVGCSSDKGPSDAAPDVVADEGVDAGCSATITPSQWTKLTTSASAYAKPTGAVVDGSGRVFVAGLLHGSMDLGNGTLAGNGVNASIFVAAWDASGAALWSTVIGDALETADARVALVPSGGVVVTAPLISATQIDASFQGGLGLVRFDASGKFVWTKLFASTDGATVAIAQDGNIVFAGEAEHSFDLGGCTVGPQPQGDAGAASKRSDAFVAKLDIASGACAWGKTFGDASGQAANLVAVDGAGNIDVAGVYSGTIDFGGATTPLVGPADPDPNGFGPIGTNGFEMFLAQLDGSGVAKWAKSFGQGLPADVDYLRSIAIDKSDRIGIGLVADGKIDFGGGVVSGSEYTVAAFDSTGTHRFSHAVSALTGPIMGAVAFDTSGNLFTTGALPTQANFGSGNVPVDSFTYRDDGIFLVAYDTSGATTQAGVYPGCPPKTGASSKGGALAFDSSGALFVSGYFDYATGDTFVVAKITP